MNVDDLERDLAALVAKYPNMTGREFVAAALNVAEGYFEADDLPCLMDIRDFAEGLRRELSR